MTSNEAIEELDTMRNIHLIFARTKEASACQLGKEALQRLDDNRNNLGFPHTMLLPGETKD